MPWEPMDQRAEAARQLAYIDAELSRQEVARENDDRDPEQLRAVGKRNAARLRMLAERRTDILRGQCRPPRVP